MNERFSPEAVVLARHGETNDNIEPIRVQGFRDTPLNDTGRASGGGVGRTDGRRRGGVVVVLGSLAS